MAEEKKEVATPQGNETPQEAKPKVEASTAAASAPQGIEPPKTEEPKAEAPQAAPAPEAAPAPAKAEEKKEAPKKEKPDKCTSCKKSIKKKRWYYRNGEYFCTKRCWTTAKKKQEKPQEEPAK